MAGDPASSRRNMAKWCLAGVLGCVLVGVVAWQIFGTGGNTPTPNDEAKAAERAEHLARRGPRKFAVKSLPLAPTAAAPTTTWPKISLAQAIAHDPFAPEAPPGTATAASDGQTDELARVLEAERATRLAETLQSLRERGVTMVLHTVHGPVATIGDRMIKVGDTVGDYRVTEIDAHGVVLEPSGPK